MPCTLKKFRINFSLIIVGFFLISCNPQNNNSNSSKNNESKINRSESTNKNEKISSLTNQNYSEIKKSIQGKWVSVQDDKAFIEFKGDTVLDIYESDIIIKSKYRISNSCPDSEYSKNAGSQEIILFEEIDKLCYTIDYVSSSNLELTYLARGNTLSYTKCKK